jgi:hypothetical protein
MFRQDIASIRGAEWTQNAGRNAMPMTNKPPAPDELYDDLDVDSGVASLPGPRGGMMHDVQARLLDLAEDGKNELAKTFDGLLDVVNELAARVESTGVAPLAGVAWQAAGLLADIQKGLRDRPVDELLDDGRALIRREPALAMGVAMAAGFLAMRLFKASGR